MGYMISESAFLFLNKAWKNEKCLESRCCQDISQTSWSVSKGGSNAGKG